MHVRQCPGCLFALGTFRFYRAFRNLYLFRFHFMTSLQQQAENEVAKEEFCPPNVPREKYREHCVMLFAAIFILNIDSKEIANILVAMSSPPHTLLCALVYPSLT